MCFSAVVEDELEKIAARLNLAQISEVIPEGPDVASPKSQVSRHRIEALGHAWIVREGVAGRLVAERMSFNPNNIKWLNNDPADPKPLTMPDNHGLLVLKGFSEWVSIDLLFSRRLIAVHELSCPFNRIRQLTGRHDPAILANFTPERQASLLVPVLFDARPVGITAGMREFVILSTEPEAGLRSYGAGFSPMSLTLSAATEWLHVRGLDEAGEANSGEEDVAIDFSEILAQSARENYTFTLYKAA